MPKIEFDASVYLEHLDKLMKNEIPALTLHKRGIGFVMKMKRFHVTLTPISNNEEQKHAQEREDAGPTEGR